jgi:hypothetical protein
MNNTPGTSCSLVVSIRSILFCCALALLPEPSVGAAEEPPGIERFVPMGAQRGTSAKITLVGKPGVGTLRIVSDEDALQFTIAENKESSEVTIASDARAGIHWLRLCNEFGATQLKPFIVGLIPEVSETEPNSRIADSQSLTAPSVTVNGVLQESGDVDTFSFPLKQGQTLFASMQAHRILGSPMDGVLQVLNSHGTVVAQNDDDIGFDPQIAWTAPADGTWYVRTFAFPASPNSTIRFAGGPDFVYRLVLTTEPVVEHASPMVHRAGTGDTALQLFGWNLHETSVSFPAGTSHLTDGFAAPFLLRNTDVPSLREEQLSTDRLLTLPVAVTGHLMSAEEVDSFTIQTVKDQKLSISVQADSIGSLLDPVLSVFGTDNKLIKEHDDLSDQNSDAELHLTMPEDGLCRVTVRDRFSHSGERWYYLLRLEETRPSWSATITSTAVTLTKEKPQDIAVQIQRMHGFAESIEFQIEGLPAGVTAACPRSEKEGESSKTVTLKLTASDVIPFQGPVRIIALAHDPGTRRPVTFATADGTHTEELWLTVR